MTNFLNDTLLPRLCAMERVLVPAALAFPDLRLYSTYPYWTNGVAITQTERLSPKERVDTYTASLYLHAGLWSEQYEGKLAEAVNGYLEDLSAALAERPGLQVNEGDVWLVGIYPTGAEQTGASVVPMGNEGQKERGILFTLNIPYHRILRYGLSS